MRHTMGNEGFASFNTETVPGKPENHMLEELRELRENPKVSNFAAKIKSLGLSLGLAMVLIGCGGLSRQEIEKMPGVKVEELAKSMENFRDIPMIKTEGVPEFVEKKTVYDWYLGDNGNLVATSKRVDYFKLHGLKDPSVTVDMMADGEKRESESPLETVIDTMTPLTGYKVSKTHQYAFIGKVIKAKGQDGKEQLFFKVSQHLDTTLEKIK